MYQYNTCTGSLFHADTLGTVLSIIIKGGVLISGVVFYRYPHRGIPLNNTCILHEYGRGANDKEMYTIIIIIMMVLEQNGAFLAPNKLLGKGSSILAHPSQSKLPLLHKHWCLIKNICIVPLKGYL